MRVAAFRRRGETRGRSPRDREGATGRPTKLTPEVAEHVRQAVRASATLKDAAKSIGVGYSTVLRWMSDGEKHLQVCAGPDSWDAERHRAVRHLQQFGA